MDNTTEPADNTVRGSVDAMNTRATLGLAALLAFTGCSVVPGAGGPPTTSRTTANSGSADGGRAPTPDTPDSTASIAMPQDDDSSAPPTPPTTEAPVATRKATVNGTHLALTVYPLVRTGAVVTLNARMDVLSGVSEYGVEVDRALAGTRINDVLRGIPNGFQVVDETNQVVHLPGRVDGSELCGPSFHGGWQNGDQVWVSCVFGAPPAPVSQATVTAATFGSFSHVPIH